MTSIVVLTGDRNVGKTTLVRRVVAALVDRGLDPVGFYTVGESGTLELVDAGTGDRTVFATLADDSEASVDVEDAVSVGRYAVDPAAIERGLRLADRDGDVLVVDEIGNLERRGDGFAPVLADLRPDRYRGVLLSVRNGVVPFVVDALPTDAAIERIEVTRSNRDDLPGLIVELLVEGGGEDDGDGDGEGEGEGGGEREPATDDESDRPGTGIG
jgi:nucleoside-triphosphatase THEP1